MSGRGIAAIRSISVPDMLSSVVWHPSGELISGGGYEANGFEEAWLYTWDAASGKLGQAVPGHAGPITCVAVSPDGTLLASAGYDHQVHVWAMPSFTRLHTFTGHTGPVHAVAFTPNGHLLISGGDIATCIVWDLATWQDVMRLKDTKSYAICSLALTPDGRRLVCGRDGGNVTVWDPTTGRHVVTLTDEFEWVLGLAISPNGSLLASGGESEVVTVWDMLTLQPIVQLLGHRKWMGNAADPNTIRTIAFHPHIPLLASGADDGTVQLWSTASGERLAVLEHPAGVSSVAFSPDGGVLVSASDAKTLTWWDLGALL